MSNRVKCQITDGIADVRLSRPEKLNAIDAEMVMAIEDIGAILRHTQGVRAVVISGEGTSFCAGLDLDRIVAIARGEPLISGVDLNARTHGPANLMQHIVWLWRELPVPVIAAISGLAFGGGFQLALAADIRIAAPEARFAALEAKWGLVPDMAGTHLMRQLAREDIVRELTYTGRIFSAREALEHGFVTRLADNPHADALALARDIAARNPETIRVGKRLLNLRSEIGAQRQFEQETLEQANLIGSPNQIEAVCANLEKRAPRFVDPELH